MEKQHSGSNTPNGANNNKMSANEIIAAQKAWRMQKRRELEARNKKKQARQQIVDSSYGNSAATVSQHSTALQNPPASSTPVPPMKRFKASYLAENAQLTAPTESSSAVVYGVQPFTSQTAGYQHYEYVGAPTLQPNSAGASLPQDEQARTAEAQRVWKEQKMREMAERKAKGTPSKRGRRKSGGVPVVSAPGDVGQHHQSVPIVTSMPTMAMAASMPITAHSMPLTSHSMPLTSHGLVQTGVPQQNQEADAETGQTAVELVAMANQTLAQNALEQYTYMGATEPKEEQVHPEQAQNMEDHHQLKVENVGEHHQQRAEEHHQQQVVEHHQQEIENVEDHNQQQLETVEVHQQVENVRALHPQDVQSVEVHHQQQVENVEEHHQQGGNVEVHQQQVVEGHHEQPENVQVEHQQDGNLEEHGHQTENVEAHEHQGETIVVTHHQTQDVEVKNVQENKSEVLDANGVAAENATAAYTDSAAAGDSFQIDGSDDIIGAAAAWHDGLGNINHN